MLLLLLRAVALLVFAQVQVGVGSGGTPTAGFCTLEVCRRLCCGGSVVVFGSIVGRIGRIGCRSRVALSPYVSLPTFSPPLPPSLLYTIYPTFFSAVFAISACPSPHAPCTMACRSRRRPLSSIVVGCLPVVCRRWPSPPSFPRIYRPIAPDRAGNDAGAGRRVCCHAWCRQRMPLAAFAVAVLAKLLL